MARAPYLAAGLLAASLALACASLAPGPADTGRIFAWEVAPEASGAGGAFLLGSVHVAKEDLRFDPAVDAAFEEAEVVVVEVDLGALTPDETAALLVETGRLAEGGDLKELVEEATWEQFDALLQENGQSAEGYRVFEPWVAMLAVSAILAQERELSGEAGVDRHFLERRSLGQELIALETLAFQLSLFDETPLEQQLAMLGALVAEAGESGDTIETLYAAWERGDTRAVEEIVFVAQDDPRLADFQERLFERRNHSMAERLDALLDDGRRYFVVVGAGHLVGETGIPALLEARGHGVRQIERSGVE